MKKFISWLLVLCLVFSVLPAAALASDSADSSESTTLNILFVGNSYSRDATDWTATGSTSQTWEIFNSLLDDDVDLTIAYLYSSAKTLAWHATNFDTATALYATASGDGTWSSTSTVSLKDVLSSSLPSGETWDIVILQPYDNEASTGDATGSRGNYAFSDDYNLLSESIPYLLTQIQTYAPDAEVYYYMHWARSTDYSSIDSVLSATATEYDNLVDVANKAKYYTATEAGSDGTGLGITNVVWAGTAIQNARSTYLSTLYCSNSSDPVTGLQRADEHVSYKMGRYIVALTFAKTILPSNLLNGSSEDAGPADSPVIGAMPAGYIEIARAAVDAAVDSDGETTTIEGYKTDPADAAAELAEELIKDTVFAAEFTDDLEEAISEAIVSEAISEGIIPEEDEDNLKVEFENTSDTSSSTDTEEAGSFSTTITIQYGYTSVEVGVTDGSWIQTTSGSYTWSGDSSDISVYDGIITIGGNGTLTLTSDLEATIYVKSGEVTIDLDGYTLTQGSTDSSSAPYMSTIYIAYGANVTITGDGTVQNNANDSSNTAGSACVFNNGTCTIENGTYQTVSNAGTAWYTILNHGTMTINGGTFTNVDAVNSSNSSLVENGYYSKDSGSELTGYVSGTNQENPTLTINGGTYNAQVSTQYYYNSELSGSDTSQTATIIIYDGTFNSAIYADSGEITIYDGTFEGTIYAGEDGEIIIYHGTFADSSASNYLATSTDTDSTIVSVKNSSGTTVVHSLVYVPASSSNIAYYYCVCENCNSYFVLQNGQYVEVSKSYVLISSSSRSSSSSGSSSSSSSSTKYDIDVDDDIEDGTVESSKSSAKKGATVTITVTPDDGYELDKLLVLDEDGDEVDITDNGDGTYTFTMPKSDVTITATFVEIEDEDNEDEDTEDADASEEEAEDEITLFTDVADGSAYYCDAVYWAVAEGVVNGTSSTTFSPDAGITRKEVVTMFWRLAGEPEPLDSETAFTDIYGTQYAVYYDAILWAEDIGLTEGKGTEYTFCPDDIVTRAEIVTFLQRYEILIEGGSGSYGVVAEEFIDVTDPAKWYYDPVYWAVFEGITEGNSAYELRFDPDVDCTRAQFVTFLYRYAG